VHQQRPLVLLLRSAAEASRPGVGRADRVDAAEHYGLPVRRDGGVDPPPAPAVTVPAATAPAGPATANATAEAAAEPIAAARVLLAIMMCPRPRAIAAFQRRSASPGGS
jgi:hypothetical protein